MIEWTLKTLKTLLFFARLCLIYQWVKLLLFPPVAERTFFQAFAALFVASDEGARLPVLAKFGIISEKIGFTPEVLEIVCVNALCLVMLMVVGTPFRLEIENVKVVVLIGRE